MQNFSSKTDNYVPALLPTVLDIHAIYSVHYFEYAKNFSFAGEMHDFWEFIYVDRGEVFITAGDREILLQKDEIAFHKPMEFHAVHAKNFTPNLIVISFMCTSPAMDYFRDRILSVNEEERALLAAIVSRARKCLSCRMDDPYLNRLTFQPDASPEMQQLIALDLTSFLLHLMIRSKSEARMNRAPYPRSRMTDTSHAGSRISVSPSASSRISMMTTLNSRKQLFRRLESYLHNHLSEPLKIPQICRDNLISRSLLCSIYKKETGSGVIEHFNQMKIEQAKDLIRGTDLSITQISCRLGYATVQYFSRQFRNMTGMSPSEYATSVKALSEKPS